MKTNYHMHTTRCNHAIGSDEDMILACIDAGFEEVGFSCHSPWPVKHPRHMRMRLDQLDEYIASIRSLQEKYKHQIQIKIGLECEYYEDDMDWLEQIKVEKGIDYLLLGNHFEKNEQGLYYGAPTSRIEDLESYVNQAIKGMERGCYAYFAHPDLIHFQGNESDYETYMTKLCEVAKRTNTPLEYNLLGVAGHRHYPCDRFWEIVSQVGCRAIIGYDAHDPQHLKNGAIYRQAYQFLKKLDIDIVEKL